MKTFSYKEPPISVHGVVDFNKKGRIQRLPDELLAKLPRLSKSGRRCPGARLCFKTNSERIRVKVVFNTFDVDWGMSIYASQSVAVYAGERTSSHFLGLICPKSYDEKTFEGTVYKSCELEDITMWLPRNEVIADIEISIDEEAEILPATPYQYSRPILYYGSSITENGCAQSVTSGYSAIISRHLDVDFYNFGFSGNARGDLDMAEYIAGVDMSIFVYDYDHNAPSVEHLRNTHEPFFRVIREKNPTLPVIMMTRPEIIYTAEHKERREIVYATYKRALDAGDKNVYFIDGETFYGESDRELCTADITHPNDLGFYRMAGVIEPVIKEILESACD